MKKSNIAFSGFMAAILVSVGAANAATTRIASQQYVDSRETSILQTVSNTYETKENVTNLTEQVTQLGDTINNEESGLTQQITNIKQQIGDSSAGLVKDINDAKTAAETAQQTAKGAQSAADALGVTVGNAESGLVKDVADLQTQVGTLDSELDSKLDSETAATTYEKVSNRTPELTADTSATMYPTVGAVRNYVQTEVSSLSSLPVDPGKMNDNSLEGSKLKDGAVSTDKIANGAVTTGKIGADAVNGDKIADDSIGAEHIKDGAVNSDAIADGSVTGTDIADGTISADNLDTALNAEIDGKEDKSNKAAVIDSANQASTDAYPSVKAVYDWTTQQIANVEFDPSTDLGTGSVSGDKLADDSVTADKIAPDAVGSEQIADGAVTSDKLDETLAGQIADISNKQDKNMGVGHENHIVTTDASGNITSAATIAQSQVTGLTDALDAKLESGDLTGYAKTTDLDAKQNRNVGAENNGKILTVGADGNITTSATIAQARVDGLETALNAKAAADDLDNLDTRVGLAENDIDALQTTVGSSTDGLVADVAALQKTASTLGTTYEQIANRTDTLDDATTASKYPTAGAVRSYVASEIAALDDTGLPVNPGNIEDGSLPGSKLQDGAITTDKIANSTILKEDLNSALQTEIDGKADLADVYTRQQTNDKIVEIAIQRPQNTCTSESDLCVLTLTKDKRLAWVPVTEPATAPVDAGPVMGSQNTDTSVD